MKVKYKATTISLEKSLQANPTERKTSFFLVKGKKCSQVKLGNARRNTGGQEEKILGHSN